VSELQDRKNDACLMEFARPNRGAFDPGRRLEELRDQRLREGVDRRERMQEKSMRAQLKALRGS